MDNTRVLLVDDEVDALTATAMYLEQDGFIVLRAASGQEAIELFDADFPDVVVLDLVLGDMSGFQVCAHIKQCEPEGVSIPVIFLSACDDADTRRRAMVDERAESFLVKPTDPRVLSAQVEAMARLKRKVELACHDVLTGLPNPRLLRSRLQEEHSRAVQRSGTIACLMIDIDNFKRFNDSYGHPVGDLVLREVAQRLKSGLRKQDFIGRYGGEEFTAILPDTDFRSAQDVAERLRQLVEREPYLVPGLEQPIDITVSIGAAIRPAAWTGPDELVNVADQALLEAKRRGRNQVRLSPVPVGHPVVAASSR